MPNQVRPDIRRKNLHRDYLAKARTLAEGLAEQHSEIEAMMLTGGVARGYADEESELDLTLFLTPDGHEMWIRRCQAPLAEGDNLVDGVYVDTTFTTVEAERAREWEPLRVWDASYAQVLLDREGRLEELLREKVCPSISPWDLHDEAVAADWYAGLALGWIDRTDVVAAHHLLNLAFDRFLVMLFGAQGEIPPFDKWRFHLSRSLPTLPDEYEEKVREWLAVRAFTAADVRRRARQSAELIAWWEDAFRVSSRLEDAIQTLRVGPVPLEEFEARFGTRVLREFPLRAVSEVEEVSGSRRVRLDPKTLRRVLDEGCEGMLPYQLDRLRSVVTSLDSRE